MRRAAIVEQAADVSRPQGLPPLAGQPVTYGPAQALAEPCGGASLPPLGDVARASGPLQAPAGSSGPAQALGGVHQHVGPVQAPICSSGPVQALEEFVNKWALCRPVHWPWVLALSKEKCEGSVRNL